MGQEEDNIPVLDLYSGFTKEEIRSIIPVGSGFRFSKEYLNSLDPKEKEQILANSCWSQGNQDKANKTKSRNALFRTFEERQEIGKAISEGQANRSEEAKKAQYDSQSKSLKKFIVDKPIEYWVEQGKKVSEGINNMTSEAKEGKKKALRDYRANLSLEDQEIFSKAVSEGLSNMTESAKATRIVNCSEGQKAYLASLTQEQLDERSRSSRKGNKGPNKPEMALGIYLGRNFPGEWAFNGQCQAGCVIGGKIPDFINVNGRKAVVEMFGNYYHDQEEEVTRPEHFKKFGFDCTIVWEYQVYLVEELNKIFGIGV